uniref:Replication stress response regulator SDE2 n=1 Tax=Panagrellus redivivus TaxID=6233 RepID=A0A7E4VTN2_PANRE
MAQTLRSGFYFAGDSSVIGQIRSADPASYYLVLNGQVVENVDALPSDAFFSLNCRLLGGKGGFGSLLRSFRIHKSANQLMCRDLTGRRLADVKEEERLRKYVAKKKEREEKAKRKEEEKLLKLKSGSKVKHHFKDKKYMRQRDVLLEQMEDAIEAGIAAEKSASPEADNAVGKSSSASPVDGSDSDSDIDLDTGMPLIKSRKRKAIVVKEVPVVEKKAKIAKPSKPVAKFVAARPAAPEPVKVVEKAEKKDFPAVNLDSIGNAAELEALGLDHLKHALEARGLKCGGTATERAARLFSVKGLTPDKYPKKIRAAPAKK